MADRIKLPRVAVMVSAAMMLMLVSCQGRTVDNMVPKGETVEVVINEPVDTDASDNISNQTDSLQNEN